MPLPSFPTGTVSGESRRDRTFPPSDADSPSSGGDPRTKASSSPPRRQSDETAVPGAAPSDAARRTDGSAARSPANGESLRERVAHLERENEALRRKVKQTQRARQNVIDHYERVIDDIGGASSSAFSSSAGGETTSTDNVRRAAEGTSATPTVRPPAPDDGLADRVARRLDVRERWR